MRSLNHCIAFVFLCWMRLGTSFTVPITTKNSLNCPTTATIAHTNDSQSRFMAQAQPETQIKTGVKTETVKKQKQAQKQESKTAGPVSKRKEEFEDAPMYKLMLLNDDSADVEHVIKSLCKICDGIDEDQAATVFKQAQAGGKAMCGIYPFERAELFKEQLQRSNPMILADLEKD